MMVFTRTIEVYSNSTNCSDLTSMVQSLILPVRNSKGKCSIKEESVSKQQYRSAQLHNLNADAAHIYPMDMLSSRMCSIEFLLIAKLTSLASNKVIHCCGLRCVDLADPAYEVVFAYSLAG